VFPPAVLSKRITIDRNASQLDVARRPNQSN